MRFHKLEAYLRSTFGARMMGSGIGSADFGALVHEAQKFYVGDVCTLEGISTLRLTASEVPHLPYDICVFEMEDNDPKGVKRSFFMLAEELRDDRDSVRVHQFTTYPVPKHMGVDLYPHSGYIEVHRATNTYDSYVNKNTLKFLDAGDGFQRLADSKMIEDSVMASVQWLWRFLLVLNCSNTETVDVGAPRFLNAKRAKRGKLPIYSYKILVIKARQRRVEGLGGTHDSPRVHLRRGHIKRRRTGNFWWEPHVVGDRARGVVMKDYRADRLLAP